MEMKKTTLAFALILLIVSVSMEVPVSAQTGCDVDACQMNCVGRPNRELMRCVRKCEIRCGPDSQVETDHLSNHVGK